MSTTTEPLPIAQALANVMKSVRAVGKDDRNDHQKFMFRGIDSVLNAVGPALREHGVIVVPEVLDVAYELVQTSTGKPSTACRVKVAYSFHGPAGDEPIRAVVAGESWDNGDKSCPKAMSVAFRTALLQSLALPTDDPDPDHDVYERAPHQERPAEQMPDLSDLADRIFTAKDADTLRALWKQNERVLDAEHGGKTIRQRILDRQAALTPPAEHAELPAGAE